MIPEDRRQAHNRAHAEEKGASPIEQVFVLLMGAIALLGFLLI